MSTFPLPLPNDVEKQAAAQAEAERYFAAHGARAVHGRAMEILARSGLGNAPREDDVIF